MVILLPVVKHFNGKVCRVIFRINDARESLDSKIKAKYNLLIDMINYSELNFNVKSKTFIQIKKLSGHFDFNNDKLFNKGYNEIIKIVEDNESANEVKKLKSYLKKYEDNELHIISLRTYYNKYALIYNNIIDSHDKSSICLEHQSKTLYPHGFIKNDQLFISSLCVCLVIKLNDL